MQLGVQTYTVRKTLAGGRSLVSVFATMRALGASCLELAVDYLPLPFNPLTAHTVRVAAETAGITVPSIQIKLRTAAEDPEGTAEYMRVLGAKLLVSSVVDLKPARALDKAGGIVDAVGYAKELEALRLSMEPYGIAVAHHNHHYEFLRPEALGGQTVFAYLAEHTEASFAVDTYWTQRGGGNILVLLEAYKNRICSLHLRDCRLLPADLALRPLRDGTPGSGTLPFPQILQAAEAAGVPYGFLECNAKKPVKAVQEGLAYLQSALYTQQ
ncbi:MAG: sugar phosphate isomerase/epimerase [Oscillospiraceae bacterium]|nr:sugar phosphate isomerase/epimerase [Oscillospiraceae bacterium]